MQAVAAFFASIITFVSGFFAPIVASNSPVDVRATQPAAAAAAQTEIPGDPFNDPAAASAVVAASAATPMPAALPPPTQTVINQPVIERIIERIVPKGAATVSTQTLAAILAEFEQSISSRIAALDPPKAAIPEQVAAAGNAAGTFFPASQRIDQLTNTLINSPTVNSPTISGGTISNAIVSGTLSGTFSGTSSFTAATTSSLSISSIAWGLLSTDGSGNIVATSTPTAASFIATSTVASRFPYASTTALSVSGTGFVGLGAFTQTYGTTTVASGQGFTIGTSQFVVQQGSGNVGIGTNAPTKSLDVSGTGKFSSTLTLGSVTSCVGGTALQTDVSGNISCGAISVGGSSTGGGWTTNSVGRVTLATSTDLAAVGATTTLYAKFAVLSGASATTTMALVANAGQTANLLDIYSSGGSLYSVMTAGGNLGLGTTSPGSMLSLGAIANFTTATSTFYSAGGINLAAGCFAKAGDCLSFTDITGTLGIAQGGTATSTQVTNGVNFFDGTRITSGTALTFDGTTLTTPRGAFSSTSGTTTIASGQGFTVGGSQFVLQQGSGNVGIGTASPNVKLNVSNGSLTLGQAVNGNADEFVVQDDASAGISILSPNNDTGWLIFGDTDDSSQGMISYDHGTGLSGVADTMEFWTNSARRLAITGAGNVGIGTTSPDSLLTLNSNTAGTQLLSLNSGTKVLRLGANYTNNIPAILTTSNDPLGFGTNGSERMRIDSSGNVGIGTTTPDFTLSVNGSIDAGPGTISTPAYMFFPASSVYGSTGFYAPAANTIGIVTGGAERMRIDSSGHIGINTAPQSNIHFYVAGDSVADFTIYGQTTKTTGVGVTGVSQNGLNFSYIGYNNNWGVYCNGVQCGGSVAWTNNSDARLKTAIQDIDASSTLASLMRLRPITYHWKDAAIDAGRGEQLGFIAQEVEPLFPALVTKGASTTITLADGSKETISDPKALDYSGFVVPLVKAVQEVALIGSTFKANLIAWLGSAGNGIGDFFAGDIYATTGTFDMLTVRRVHSDDVCVKKSNGAEVCITGDQIAAVLAAADQTADSPSTTQSATSEAPVIEINGNATSTIEVGDTYNDLGARIVAPESDLNLGIVILLDGATTTQISIDTAQPGTHTILYTVTSPATGLTGSALRTVIIAPAEQSPEQPANDNPFNAPPANDNVSTSTLLNTEPTAVSL